jgi:predicted cupin superfamily sugar epimerase
VRRDQHGRYLTVVDRPATAEALDLVPHPEGGWYRQTWASPTRFAPSGYGGERAAATAILFLLRPDEQSAWHRVRSDELWFWHSGGPLELRLGGSGDAPHSDTVIVLGGDVSHRQQPQALVPGDTWQAARPAAGAEVLASCVVAPGFDFADFTLHR